MLNKENSSSNPNEIHLQSDLVDKLLDDPQMKELVVMEVRLIFDIFIYLFFVSFRFISFV